LMHYKPETHLASIKKCNVVHGNKDRVRAFGFKSPKLALAA